MGDSIFGDRPDSPGTAATGWAGVWAVVLIFAVTLLAYWPALHGGFIWDDDGHVTRPDLRSLAGLARIWTEVGATQQYYPVLHSAFWLEHRLWGDAVFGYHFVNILLHAGSALFVRALMRRLALPGATLGALIFALHPVEVESVAWISEQKNTLSGLFYLGAAFMYLNFDRSRRRGSYLAAFGLFALALLTKTVTATLPAALLVIFWWQRGRLDPRRDFLPLVPWLVLGCGAGMVSAWVERFAIGAQGADFTLTATQRGLVAGRAVWFYFGKLVWPADLIFIYPRWNPDPTAGWQYLFPLGAMAVLIILLAMMRTRRGPLAGFLIFVGTLFPALGFVNVYPFLFSYVADHFQYLASLGVIVPAAAGLTAAAARLPLASRRVAMLAAVVLVGALGVVTTRQSALYRDAGTLYRETLARNPDCWLAHTNLANILAKDPAETAEAISHYEAALRLKPDLAEAHLNLANSLAGIPGRRDDAIAHYETALRLKPDLAEAHNNLGKVLAGIPGRTSEAVVQFTAAVKIDPQLAEAHANLGKVLAADRAHLPEAIAEYEVAIRLRPELAGAHFNLANALAEFPDRQAEAIAEYEEALRLKPGFAEAHYNLGNLLLKKPGRLDEAIAHYATALKLRPEWESLRRLLAGLRGTKPQ